MNIFDNKDIVLEIRQHPAGIEVLVDVGRSNDRPLPKILTWDDMKNGKFGMPVGILYQAFSEGDD